MKISVWGWGRCCARADVVVRWRASIGYIIYNWRWSEREREVTIDQWRVCMIFEKERG
jgi:hypothetical protein